jgi:hypothetical protein
MSRKTLNDTLSLSIRHESSQQILSNVVVRTSVISFSLEVKPLNKPQITVTQCSMGTANSKLCTSTLTGLSVNSRGILAVDNLWHPGAMFLVFLFEPRLLQDHHIPPEPVAPPITSGRDHC